MEMLIYLTEHTLLAHTVGGKKKGKNLTGNNVTTKFCLYIT